MLGTYLGVSFNPKELRRPGRATSSITGFVYVIARSDGQVKVGTTSNTPQRMRALQTGNALPLTYAFVAGTTGNPVDVETAAHRLLDYCHMVGDWFQTTPEVAMAAVSAAAARLDRTLVVADPQGAARNVPPMPFQVAGPAERRRGTANIMILLFVLFGTIIAGIWLNAWMNDAMKGTRFDPAVISGERQLAGVPDPAVAAPSATQETSSRKHHGRSAQSSPPAPPASRP